MRKWGSKMLSNRLALDEMPNKLLLYLLNLILSEPPFHIISLQSLRLYFNRYVQHGTSFCFILLYWCFILEVDIKALIHDFL